MKFKTCVEKIGWFWLPIVISVVLILCEFYLACSCNINVWNTSRWITVAIIIAAFVLAVLSCGGKNENKK